MNHMRTVRFVDRSAVNEQRWQLTLSCGHSIWVTSKQRPRAKRKTCPTCQAKQAKP